MRSLIEACEDKNFPAEIVIVLSNKEVSEGATGLDFARSKNIKTAVVSHKKLSQEINSREEFEKKLSAEIESSGAQIICLAGFMRLLSNWFVKRWFDQIINIHPSLLPDFKGANAVADAIRLGAKVSGCTTHFVREEMDSGPIILQSAIPVLTGDDSKSLAARILIEEHKIYPESLKLICDRFFKQC